jgi:hypothetical protein
MSKFFTFRQNNSGGIDHIDENLNRYVIIEANDAQHANERAQEIGIYFDGVSDGTDCDCCGDRWHRVYDSDADEVPSIYGEPVTDEGSNYAIHYLNKDS